MAGITCYLSLCFWQTRTKRRYYIQKDQPSTHPPQILFMTLAGITWYLTLSFWQTRAKSWYYNQTDHTTHPPETSFWPWPVLTWHKAFKPTTLKRDSHKWLSTLWVWDSHWRLSIKHWNSQKQAINDTHWYLSSYSVPYRLKGLCIALKHNW